MDRRTTYPVWIDSQTAIRFRCTGTEHQAHLAVEHGRTGDPTITIVGPIEQLHRLVVEADRQLTRWRLDHSPAGS